MPPSGHVKFDPGESLKTFEAQVRALHQRCQSATKRHWPGRVSIDSGTYTLVGRLDCQKLTTTDIKQNGYRTVQVTIGNRATIDKEGGRANVIFETIVPFKGHLKRLHGRKLAIRNICGEQ